MLHRVAPIDTNKITANENLKVSPQFLESFIEEAKHQGYSFISLDTLYDGFMKDNIPHKFIAITLDDGYKDNLTFGYPVFKAHNVPFCIYVTTSFPQSCHNMWWFGLEDYLLKNDTITINNGGGESKICECSSLESKLELFLHIRNTIIQQYKSYSDDILDFPYNPRDYDSLVLDWKDLEILRDEPLATIGNHTHNHPIFNNLTASEVENDIKKAQDLFALHDIYPTHFAYPFGGKIEVDSSYFKIPQQLGFKTATTTRNGTIYKQHKDMLYNLPRVMLQENSDISNIYKIRRHKIIAD